MVKIPVNVGWFDTKDFSKTLVKIMVILRAFDPCLKGHCNPGSGTNWVGVESAHGQGMRCPSCAAGCQEPVDRVAWGLQG